ncbi:hypothetical protein PUMCH_000600 [Australozyma saopauloensis]|uniref:Clathrin light chain n=1 Tax=Australozyma saopauloensis TaxID=291208 RepID=A0AAX4H4J5_9ASCO|nr:hypothetical protein PUMCH_000600 [[Candida] saopauloensis]
MADKFPEIDVASEPQELEGDFFSREAELVGDEFKTDEDKAVLAESEPEDNEIQEFKENFPEVGEGADGANQIVANGEEDDEDDEFEGFLSQPASSNNAEESQPLKEWAQRRQLEIEERDNVSAKKKKEIIAAAEQSIDDFYDNYNSKKEQLAEQVLKEQTEFLEKRDGFLSRGTLWDRVNEIIDEVGDLELEGRDKSRFKGLLTKLKGKENVPGAGGYTS